MINCELFVFGRTKAKDYRWLLRPIVPLSASFFARVLEFNSAILKGNQKLFVSVSQSQLCLFAVFFQSKFESDERGRPISFSVGLTCDPKFVREFNYRLPAFIAGIDKLISSISGDISSAVLSDSDIRQMYINTVDLDPFVAFKQSGKGLKKENSESVRFVSSENMKSKLWQDEVSDDLTVFSQTLLLQVDTPSFIANFDAKACGRISDSITISIDNELSESHLNPKSNNDSDTDSFESIGDRVSNFLSEREPAKKNLVKSEESNSEPEVNSSDKQKNSTGKSSQSNPKSGTSSVDHNNILTEFANGVTDVIGQIFTHSKRGKK